MTMHSTLIKNPILINDKISPWAGINNVGTLTKANSFSKTNVTLLKNQLWERQDHNAKSAIKDNHNNLKLKQDKIKPLRKKSIESYPETIRGKIQFYESIASPKSEFRRPCAKEKQEETDANESAEEEAKDVAENKNIKTDTLEKDFKSSTQIVVKAECHDDEENKNLKQKTLEKIHKLSECKTHKWKRNSNIFRALDEIEIIETQSKSKLENLFKIDSLDADKFNKNSMHFNAINNIRCASFNNVASSIIKEEIYRYGMLMKQATTAIAMCKSTKKFANTINHAEAEKLLLTSNLERERLIRRYRNLPYQTADELWHSTAVTITFSDVNLPIRRNKINSKAANWFLLTCETEDGIQCSKIVDLKKNSGAFNLDEEFVLDNVCLNFEAHFKIYQYKQHPVKKENINLLCYKNEVNLEHNAKHYEIFYKDVYSGDFLNTKIEESAFKLCAHVKITKERLCRNKVTLILDRIQNNDPIYGLIQFNVTAKCFQHKKGLSGFLEMAKGNGGIPNWKSGWCILTNTSICLWRCPEEENVTTPILELNLVESSIEVKTGEKDEKSCLILNVGSQASEEYYLALKSDEDIKLWEDMVRFVIRSYNTWKNLYVD